MTQNPVEANPVTRFILGFAVIFAMFLAGGAVGWAGSTLGVPFGGWIGTAAGAAGAFAAFAVLYRRYDASFDSV